MLLRAFFKGSQVTNETKLDLRGLNLESIPQTKILNPRPQSL